MSVTSTSPVGSSSRVVTAGVIVVVGGLGLILGPLVPVVNEVVVALVLGFLLANLGGSLGRPDEQTVSFMLGRVLKGAVVLLGAGINLAIVADIGGPALATTALSVVVAIAATWAVGTRMGLEGRPTTLIGVGTAICGASAIAAVAPLLRARREEIGVALATIFTFNAAALIAYPLLGSLLGMSQLAFGTWAGIGVHDTAASVATGFAYGTDAGEAATVVKLTRTLFLVPLILVVAARTTDVAGHGMRAVGRSFPWFVLGFVALAVANTLGWLGTLGTFASDAAKLAVVFVAASVGVTLRVSRMAAIGGPLVITGLVGSLVVGSVALLALRLLGVF